MINRIYRLMDTKRVEMALREISPGPGMVLAKPDYMAVCAADHRYYFGMRDRAVLDSKLPMALIHEATAAVLHDSDGRFSPGERVVLIPLLERGCNRGVKGNYDPENAFMSSGRDGFMQDFVLMPRGALVPIPGEYSLCYVFSELLSVAINAADAFERACVRAKDSFGVWGDGSMGYTMCLLLKRLYPEAKLYIVGKTLRKLQMFSFVERYFSVNTVPDDLRFAHCFDCVGGKGSESALRQMLRHIEPQGCIGLLGVSEEQVSVDTRTVLEKGLTLVGNSRSDASDMCKAVAMIHGDPTLQKYLEMLVSDIVEVHTEHDIAHVFEQDSLNDFKTVVKWRI